MPLTDAELIQATALAVNRYSFIKKIMGTGQGLSAEYLRLCLITETLLCCTSDNRGGTAFGKPLTLHYTPVALFALPETLTVTMGGVLLNQGTDYTWNRFTGELYISSVTGNLDITVACVLDGTVYTQCSYIQSSGNEWINTGITGKANTRVQADFVIKAAVSGWWAVFGACAYNINRSYLFGINNLSTITVQSGTSSYKDVSYSFNLQTHYRIDMNPPYTYVNDALVCTLNHSGHNTPVPLALFWQNYSSSTNMAKARIQLYSCKIYDGNTLVRNYIPAVRNADSVAGLFDTVSMSFFTNAGTGAFTYG
jgi:hypothetical protein